MHKPTTNKSKYFAEMKRRCINRAKENKVDCMCTYGNKESCALCTHGWLVLVHAWLYTIQHHFHWTVRAFDILRLDYRHITSAYITYTVLLLFTPIHSRFCGFFAAIHPPNKWASLNDNLKNFNLLIFCMKAAFCYHPPWGRKFWGKFWV